MTTEKTYPWRDGGLVPNPDGFWPDRTRCWGIYDPETGDALASVFAVKEPKEATWDDIEKFRRLNAEAEAEERAKA